MVPAMPLTVEEIYSALQTMLLSFYDDILVCNRHGAVVWETQGVLDRYPMPSAIAQSAFQLRTKSTTLQKTWDGEEVMVTTIPIYQAEKDPLVIIAFRKLMHESQVQPMISHMNRKKEEEASIPGLIFTSKKMRHVIRQAKQVAQTSASTLLTGESGVGKEKIATLIHRHGSRADKPFIKVNCGAIPENLLESELFGYTRGAFTGADPKGKAGYFTLAHTGVLFLDEIGELPLHLQVKLLRVLQEKEVTPIGGTQPIKIDIQIIAATNQNLEQKVQEGTFRKDLYYRLNVVPIHIPALRERTEDIPLLAECFLCKYNQTYQKSIEFSMEATELLTVYPWHGNVRELEHIIERIVVTTEMPVITAPLLQTYLANPLAQEKNLVSLQTVVPLQTALEQVEEQLLELAMKQYSSIKVAAKALQISQPTMSRKYKKLKEKKKRHQIEQNEKEFDVLEQELNKQLRSVAIVTAASLNSDDVKQLKRNLSVTNPYYQKLQKKLTMIRELEGKIQWNYIWMMKEDGRIINLVADQRLAIKPGEEYKGPKDMMRVVYNAFKGHVGVTPIYMDKFGEWKSSIAPIHDENETVIAILGSDFSASYVAKEIQKLKRILKIKG